MSSFVSGRRAVMMEPDLEYALTVATDDTRQQYRAHEGE